MRKFAKKISIATMLAVSLWASGAKADSYQVAREGAEIWIYIEAARIYCHENAPASLAKEVASMISPHLKNSVDEAERQAIEGAHIFALEAHRMGNLVRFCDGARALFARWR